MRKTQSLILGVALVAMTASVGFAQSLPSGLYVRGDLGAAHGTDTDFHGQNLGATAPFSSLNGTKQKSNFDTSFIFGGGLGYRFTPAYRADVTLDYIPDLHASGQNSGFASLHSDSRVSSLVGLFNGYIDINGLWNVFGPFQPYIGAGVGLAHTDLGRTGFSGSIGATSVTGSGISGNTTTHFAWGAGAGVGYPITPNLTLDLGYKYLDLGEMQTGGQLSSGATTINIAPAKADFHVHTLMIGLRWTFGGPEAPPPPAPVPAAAPAAAPPPPPSKQEFIVFFEFDKSNLTADGQKVVDAAAAAYRRGGSAKISVAGYTDAAGTAPYNMALSQRRARTVGAALVRNGVPQDQIDMSYFGKTHQRVPTPDGVREPQNRRVEIEF
jgi:OmpA-OmpF porin, OOP family